MFDRVSLSGIGNCFELGILEQLPNLRISAIFGQPGNVMFCCFYDIIAKVIAAQRFPALALLALDRKCHEMCGCVTFHDIFCPVPSTPQSGEAASQSIPH
jgi:hypothetical protein